MGPILDVQRALELFLPLFLDPLSKFAWFLSCLLNLSTSSRKLPFLDFSYFNLDLKLVIKDFFPNLNFLLVHEISKISFQLGLQNIFNACQREEEYVELPCGSSTLEFTPKVDPHLGVWIILQFLSSFDSSWSLSSFINVRAPNYECFLQIERNKFSQNHM